MDVQLELDFDLDELLSLLEDELASAVLDHLEEAFDDIGDKIRRDAASNAPVWSGELQDDLDYVVEVDDDELFVRIGSDLPQAGPQEYGTDPFMPPPSALREWAGSVLGDEDAAFPVALSIADEGLDEHRYLRSAMESNMAYAQDRVESALEDAFDEVFG